MPTELRIEQVETLREYMELIEDLMERRFRFGTGQLAGPDIGSFLRCFDIRRN